MSERGKAERNERHIAYALFFAAVFCIAEGIYEMGRQGAFWEKFTILLDLADFVTANEVTVEGFALSSIFTSIGGLIAAWLILASTLTEKFTRRQKNIIFVTFAIFYIVVIFAPAKIAGDKLFGKARAAMQNFNKGTKGRTGTQK